MKRVLFICTGNRARSQMAEALLRFHGGGLFEAHSAGTEPKGLAELTVEVMAERGVEVSGQRSKHIGEYEGQEFDYVITVCDSARQTCPFFPGKTVLHWDIEDPDVPMRRGVSGLDAFRAARDDIRGRVLDFVKEHGCIFCRILAGDLPASYVYEDDEVCAFMDIRPITPGHVLVIPRLHAESLTDVPADVSAAMMRAVQGCAEGLRRSGVRMDTFNVFLADGVAAGQEVPHAHLHIIPRYEGDGWRLITEYGSDWVQRPREELDALAERIRAGIAEVSEAK
jgi:diadenosine tetraphosphate (Ap4A) HIT family hydrolase/protein-tyrosine-phosphatase